MSTPETALAEQYIPAVPSQPLTERILSRLPGPRFAWMLVWASAMPLVIAVLPDAGATDPGERVPVAAIFFAASVGGLAVVHALAKALAGSQPAVVRLAGTAPGGRVGDPFRSVGSTAGPMTISLLSTLVFAAPDVLASPSVAGAAAWVVSFAAGIPMYTLLWVCGSILIGVDRMGRLPLHLASYQDDRSLGLRKFGRLAFFAFLPVLVVSLAWTLVGGITSLRDIFVNGGIIFLMMAFLLLSLYRLHRQMVETKARHLSEIRAQIAAILTDAAATPAADLPVLASRLQLAESRERRAQSIQEWPFEEGIQRSLVAIATSVVITILGRLVLHQVGL